jgi:hypothetical protein
MISCRVLLHSFVCLAILAGGICLGLGAAGIGSDPNSNSAPPLIIAGILLIIVSAICGFFTCMEMHHPIIRISENQAVRLQPPATQLPIQIQVHAAQPPLPPFRLPVAAAQKPKNVKTVTFQTPNIQTFRR